MFNLGTNPVDNPDVVKLSDGTVAKSKPDDPTSARQSAIEKRAAKKRRVMDDRRDESPFKLSGFASTGGTDAQTIYCGDNLDKLRTMPSSFVDLIYIDPPFNSNRDYEVFWGDTREKRAFEDRHESNRAYIDFMRPRCVELRRVLKDSGSFYYHCDWHASHYVRVMLDQIFGANNFRSEIIWKRNAAKGLGSKCYPNNHDTIFYYTVSADFTWNRPFVPYVQDNLDGKTADKYRHQDDDGRIYRLDNLINPNPNRPNLTYEFLGVTKVWRWTKDRMEAAYQDGLVIQTRAGAVPQLKRYLDEQDGRPVDDVWADIPPINSQAAERLGYPTQKPLPLLERIVQASSDPDDLILDAFCGCGTALVAAQRLERRWIGIDISPTACRVMAQRLEDDCKLRERRDFAVRDMPHSEQFLRKLPHFEFENWAVVALGGIPNSVKVGDMGIDGRIFPVSAIPQKEKDRFGFIDHWYPIQVKQKDKASRPDIDAFEAVMMREERSKGFFVSFDFTLDAENEIRRFWKQQGKEIIPVKVNQILSGEVPLRLT
jgi:DNA modification methylase